MKEELSCDLSAKTCKPCEGGVPPMQQAEVERMLEGLNGWEQAGKEIARTFHFKDYYETVAFVNATAWISHREDHHPDLEVGYNQCHIRFREILRARHRSQSGED